MAAVGCFAARSFARTSRRFRPHPAAHLPYPQLDLPLQISGSQYFPVAWSDVPGWNDDDQLAAYQTFRASCKPIAAQHTPPPDPKALGTSLRDPCRGARGRDFRRRRGQNFLRGEFRSAGISRLGEGAGFVTGYYEPVIDGSRTQNDVYNVPVYRRPSNLFVRGTRRPRPNCRTRDKSSARSAAASSCPITTAARSRTA